MEGDDYGDLFQGITTLKEIVSSPDNGTGNTNPVVINDVNVGSSATNNVIVQYVKTEQPSAGQLIIQDPLNIKLHPTDPTKSVLAEDEGSYNVRKDSNLRLELMYGMGLIAPGLKPRLKIWVSYRNISYKLPVQTQDEELKAGATAFQSLAVFALRPADNTTTIEWYQGPQGEIVASVSNYEEIPFIKFTSVSSEVKRGNGWILHCQLEWEDQSVTSGTVGVKSLKIIRSKTAGGIKRKRNSSTGSTILPPSPITSEDGSDREDTITAMTKEELQIALQHYQEMAMSITQELIRR